jgi:hydrogenase expression/formation protein HypC
MCIGIPVRIIEAGEHMALCEGPNGHEHLNMMLIGPQPEGTWLLGYLGSARQVLSEEEAEQILQAVEDIGAMMRGEEVEIDKYFADSQS